MPRGPEGDGEVEAQLEELQRRYRVMEGSRRSYSEDSQRLIGQQRQVIEKLRQDNDTLKSEVALQSKVRPPARPRNPMGHPPARPPAPRPPPPPPQPPGPPARCSGGRGRRLRRRGCPAPPRPRPPPPHPPLLTAVRGIPLRSRPTIPRTAEGVCVGASSGALRGEEREGGKGGAPRATGDAPGPGAALPAARRPPPRGRARGGPRGSLPRAATASPLPLPPRLRGGRARSWPRRG